MDRHVQQTLIDDRYELLQLLGSGGMAQVYRAHDGFLGRDVALKILREQYSEDEQFVERFRQEAQSAASLSHPNIVQIYGRGRSEDGRYYIVMEYVPGGTLKEYLQGRGPLEADSAAEVISQIARALRVAHKRGVVHRDVKPHNMLITKKGHVKVADFGIARAASAITVSQTSQVLGTVNYMSPEHAMGKPATPANDLYSVGVVLYEMLTGKIPFEAESPTAVSMKHINEPPRPPKELNPEVPEGMNALVMKLLSKKAEARHADAGELVGDLERARSGLPPATADVAPPVDVEVEYAADHSVASAPGTALGPALGASGPVRGAKGLGRKVSFKMPFALMALAVLLALLGATSWYLGPGSVEQSVAGTLQAATGEDPASGRTTVGRSSPESDGTVYVHRATAENVSDNSTYLDNPLLNNNPNAVVSVTQNWNPGGGDGTYNDHPVGVWYDSSIERWAVFNQDRTAMPEGAAFNISASRDAE